MGRLATAVLLGLVALFGVLWVVLPKGVSHRGVGGSHAPGASQATPPEVAPHHAQDAGEPAAANALAAAEPPSPALEIVVLDPSGAPAAGTVWLLPHDPAGIRRREGLHGGRILFGAVAPGRYDVTLSGTPTDSIPDTSVDIRVGCAHRRRDVVVPTAGPVRMQLAEGVPVRGHVALPEGLQLPGACLQATLPDDGRVIGLGSKDGAFDLGSIPRGTWTFRVRAPGGETFAPIVRAIGGPIGDLRLSFRRGADPESNPWIPDLLWEQFGRP